RQLLDAVESGRITAEQYQAIKKVHPNYVPHRLIDAMDENVGNVKAGGSMQLTPSGIEKTDGGSAAGIEGVDAAVVKLLIKQNRLNEVNRANQVIFESLGEDPEAFGFRPLRTAAKVREREKYAAALSDLRTGIALKLKRLREARVVDKSLEERLRKLDQQLEKAENKFYADLTATGVDDKDAELTRLMADRERDKAARAQVIKDFQYEYPPMEDAYKAFRETAKRRPWMLESDVSKIRTRLRRQAGHVGRRRRQHARRRRRHDRRRSAGSIQGPHVGREVGPAPGQAVPRPRGPHRARPDEERLEGGRADGGAHGPARRPGGAG